MMAMEAPPDLAVIAAAAAAAPPDKEPLVVMPPEPPKEHEEDAMPVKGPKVEKPVEFLVPDTTVNMMPGSFGNLLMAMQDNGVQHLLAGARANTGIKAGRYMFEVKIVEFASPSDSSGPYPRNLLRVGFSTAGSSLLLDSSETETSVCFDSEGRYSAAKVDKGTYKLNPGSVVACLLNLQKDHPNFNTISLFKDGKRIVHPQPIPESLHGKTLYPTVAFKCMSLHTNFGPEPLLPLPFVCHMVGGALKAHVEVKTYTPPKECSVIFPISLPDEGSFDWVDDFIDKNPTYIELSDRKIREWAEKSAYWSKRGIIISTSNDKPEMHFGVQRLDDGFSVKRMLRVICAMQKRNYVVMEVKGNLMKEERALNLEAFKDKGFKISAVVIVGEPPISFVKKSRELLLRQKQEAADRAFRLEQAAKKQKWLFAKRQKELEKIRKKAAKEREKMAKAKVKALEEARKKALGEQAGEEAKKEEEKKEEPEVVEDDDDEDDDPDEPEPVDEDPPKVTLTDEERKLKFRTPVIPDLTMYALNTNFTKFSIPEDDEDFDEIKFEFAKDEGKAKKYVQEWITAKKLVTRVEDIQPSTWFFTVKRDWDKVWQEWQQVLSKFRSALATKRAAKAAKEAKRKQREMKAAAAKAKAEKEGTEPPPEEPVEVEEDEDDTPEPDVDFDGLDVFGVEDVKDIGGGIPLHKEFTNDDWTLMTLSFELHLLGHAFKRDCKDADRVGIHADHVDFYYSKYFKKALVPKDFGVETVKDVVGLCKDIVYIDSKNVFQNALPEEMETYQVFIKVAEEARRFRQICVDHGDESKALKFVQRNEHHHHHHQNHHGHHKRKDWHHGGMPGGPGIQQQMQPGGWHQGKGGGKGWQQNKRHKGGGKGWVK